MADEKLYLDIIPKIRVYEKKLIDDLKYSRMVDSDDLENVFKVLSETVYGENVSDDVDVSNYELVLSLEFEKLFKSMRDIFDNRNLIEIFLKKYKYNNLKLMLKSKFLGTDIVDSLFKIDGMDNEFIYSCIKLENFSSLDDNVSSVVKRVFKDFEENKNPQRIDTIIDKQMFEELIEDSRIIGNEFLCKYIKILIDVFNIRTLFRIKKLNLDRLLFDDVIISGGNIPVSVFKVCFSEPKENILNRFSVTSVYKHIKDGLEFYVNEDNLRVLDKELDNYVMSYLKGAKIITTGLAPIIGYINAKENEIKNIRIILVGKINGVDSDSIRRRLRESYV